ncbi:MAG: CBS domain-containing protein [Candidatus Helarchaeota archaeon]
MKMKVSEIMETDLRKVSIDKDRLIVDAIEMMEKQNNSLLLTMNNNELAGILTERDLADRLGSKKSGTLKTSSIRVSSVQSDIPQAIDPDTDTERAAEIMLRTNASGLPILKNGELIGLIDETILTRINLKFRNSSIEQIMTTNVFTVRPDDRLIHARKLLFEKQISFLPVCEGPRLVGFISEGMIARAFAKFRDSVKKKHQEERLRHILVEDFMKIYTEGDGLTLTPNASIADAARIMIEEGVRGVPVVKQGTMDLIGLVTKSDMVKVQIMKDTLRVTQ